MLTLSNYLNASKLFQESVFCKVNYTSITLSLCVFSLVFLSAGNYAHATYELSEIVTDLNNPVNMANAADGSGRLFIVSRNGQILVHDGTQALTTVFVDISSKISVQGEGGLLGLAFHPSYSSNGLFFVTYTDVSGDSIIERYSVSSTDNNVADSNSAEIILRIEETSNIHRVNDLKFGQDGYLYIISGDGGPVGDPGNFAQSLNTFRGKILRIDVDNGFSYSIPEDNPFIGTPDALEEIWALGLRNPWRFSFDRLNGDMFLGDVGESSYEEINYQSSSSTGGENYGWRLMEGNHCYNPTTDCNNGELTLPIIEYDHSEGCSVVAGYRYRGGQIQELYGDYIYADYCQGIIWNATENTESEWSSAQLFETDLSIVGFGEDEEGEIYVIHYSNGQSNSGAIYKIVNLPDSVSQVGNFEAGRFILDVNSNQALDGQDSSFRYGGSGDIPVAGDWNGDGITDIGVYSDGVWLLDSNGSRVMDDGEMPFSYGRAINEPVTGDWNGDGVTEVGIFVNGRWIMDYNASQSLDESDISFRFGGPADIPVTGDWNGDGVTEVGVFSNGYWLLDYNGNQRFDRGDVSFFWGRSRDIPVTGDWNSDGITDVGIFYEGNWLIDSNGNYTLDDDDENFRFGSETGLPITGLW